MIRYHVVEPNPPKGKKRKAPARRRAVASKRPSAAQVRARALFARRARAGTLKKRASVRRVVPIRRMLPAIVPPAGRPGRSLTVAEKRKLFGLNPRRRSGRNPLTRREAGGLLRTARKELRYAKSQPRLRQYRAGRASGLASAVGRIGLHGASRGYKRGVMNLRAAAGRAAGFEKNTQPRGRSANNPRRKRMATAKQIAWRKKFAAMARAGTLRKGSRRNPRGRPLSGKVYRPRLSRVGKKSVGRVAARHYRRALKIHMKQIRSTKRRAPRRSAKRRSPRRTMTALQRRYFGPRGSRFGGARRARTSRKRAARNPGGMSYSRTRRSRKIRRSHARRPARRGHRRSWRNPGIVATLKGANPFSMAKAKQVGAGVLGAVAVMTLSRFIPASVVQMIPAALLPIVPFALAGLAAAVAGRFLPGLGSAVLVGGSTAAGVALVGTYAPSALSIGMSPQQKAGFLQLPRGTRLQGFLGTPRGTRLAGLGALQVQGGRMGALQIPQHSGMAGLPTRTSFTKGNKSF